MTERESVCTALAVSRRHGLAQMASLWLAGCWPGLAFAQTSGPVRVGFLRHYAPFSFLGQDGQLQGFDLDVMRRMAQVMNIELLAEPEGMAVLSQKVKSGQIAWIGNQLLLTPENRREFDFVRPSYALIQLSSIQHEDDSRDFLSLDDLYGKKLGVLEKTGIEEQSRGVVGKTVVGYKRIEDAFQDLAAKKLDAVLEENLIADYFIERHQLPLKVAAPFAAPIPVGLPVPKGQKELQEKLSAAIRVILKDGSFKVISEKWFGYDVSRSRVGHAMSG